MRNPATCFASQEPENVIVLCCQPYSIQVGDTQLHLRQFCTHMLTTLNLFVQEHRRLPASDELHMGVIPIGSWLADQIALCEHLSGFTGEITVADQNGNDYRRISITRLDDASISAKDDFERVILRAYDSDAAEMLKQMIEKKCTLPSFSDDWPKCPLYYWFVDQVRLLDFLFGCVDCREWTVDFAAQRECCEQSDPISEEEEARRLLNAIFGNGMRNDPDYIYYHFLAYIKDEYSWTMYAPAEKLKALQGRPLYEICGDEICSCTNIKTIVSNGNGVHAVDDENGFVRLGRTAFLVKSNAERVLAAMNGTDYVDPRDLPVSELPLSAELFELLKDDSRCKTAADLMCGSIDADLASAHEAEIIEQLKLLGLPTSYYE